MKKTNLVKSLFAVIAVAIAFTACSQKKQYVDLGELKTLEDSAAYVLGIYEGLGMKGQGIELNPEIFAKAYQQGYAGDTAGCFTREQADEIMRKFQDKMIEKQQSMAKQSAIPYRQAAEIIGCRCTELHSARLDYNAPCTRGNNGINQVIYIYGSGCAYATVACNLKIVCS